MVARNSGIPRTRCFRDRDRRRPGPCWRDLAHAKLRTIAGRFDIGDRRRSIRQQLHSEAPQRTSVVDANRLAKSAAGIMGKSNERFALEIENIIATHPDDEYYVAP